MAWRVHQRRGQRLHAECFGHPVLGDDEWDWRGQVEDHLRGFDFDACGFTPTNAGLMEL
jgi:hypothetical protein